jgi:hypothetical protein
MKKSLFSLALLFLLFSCGEANPNAEFEKKIYQKIDVAGMGMLEDLKIQSVEKVNDTTYKATHTFTNPMMKKEMRISRNYFFTQDGSSISDYEDLTVEMKSQGEWVKASLF